MFRSLYKGAFCSGINAGFKPVSLLVGSSSSRPFPVSLLASNLLPCTTGLSVAGLHALSTRFTVGRVFSDGELFPFHCWAVIPRGGETSGIQELGSPQE